MFNSSGNRSLARKKKQNRGTSGVADVLVLLSVSGVGADRSTNKAEQCQLNKKGVNNANKLLFTSVCDTEQQ